MILGFYKSASHPPKSVILVGHSMVTLIMSICFRCFWLCGAESRSMGKVNALGAYKQGLVFTKGINYESSALYD